MIVDPDFFDHWRTGMVADILQDPCAPIYIMRLWAHCQDRKSDTFIMPTRGLKAQCRFPGDAQLFEAALIEAGFIARIDNSIHVNGWAEKNAKLLASSENGKAGGRPRKNQTETQEEPNENQTETKQEPTDNLNIENQNLSESDKSRVDKIRDTSSKDDGGSNPDQQASPTTAQQVDACPHQQIIDLYHAKLPMGVHVRQWTPARQQALRTRWREDAGRQSLEWWGRFFDYVAESDFLTGRVSSKDRRPFEVSLDWLCKAENFVKVIEGRLHNNRTEVAA